MNQILHQQVIERLNQFIRQHLPLVVNMGLEIKSYDGKDFIVTAPLSLNHNDKGTGFGGSLYCLCLTNAIGLVFLKCFEKGLNPDLVVSKAEIQYKLPITDTSILSHCLSPEPDEWKDFFDRFQEIGKASINLHTRIFTGNQEAVLFAGRFSIVGESETTVMD